MIKSLITPNLPKNKVKHCLIGEIYNEEISELTDLGINCLKLKKNPLIDAEISHHADILAFNFGNGKILVNKGSIGENELKNIGINEVTYINIIASPYPKDIPLNVAYIGDKIISNRKYTAKEIIDFTDNNGITIINTNQGYARCNLCIINEHAVITEDKGLAHLLKNYQFDVLLISSGDVILSETHYGFLGGASCKLTEKSIYFSGNIENHRDYEKIIEFLNKYHIEPIYNRNRKLRDFGGIIQLTEEK